MKISDKEFLELTLRTAKLELNEAEIQSRISFEQYKLKKEMLQKQINSIERQLEEKKDMEVNV